MNKYILFLSAFLLFTSIDAQAQRKRRQTKKQQKEEIVVPVDPRIQIMTNSTQDIIFIDSIVTDKKSFIVQYMLSPETGSIYKAKDFFNSKEEKDLYVYQNEFENQYFMSAYVSDTIEQLFKSDMIGDTWSEPIHLKEFSDTSLYQNVNYPFMMPDGKTFYFAATGKESIGGYDIFRTRYDVENSKFLKAENIGMPFNSTANDYMYVIDEYSNLGWFATDRNQPEGKVCIYIFIPNNSYTTHPRELYSEEQMKALASINRIKDTWKDGHKRREALERLKFVRERLKNPKAKAERMDFVINDNISYTSISDFKDKENAEKYKTLVKLINKHHTISKALEITRNYYAKADSNDRNEIKNEILENEKEYYELELEIKRLEKEIRNNENKIINNK